MKAATQPTQREIMRGLFAQQPILRARELRELRALRAGPRGGVVPAAPPRESSSTSAKQQTSNGRNRRCLPALSRWC